MTGQESQRVSFLQRARATVLDHMPRGKGALALAIPALLVPSPMGDLSKEAVARPVSNNRIGWLDHDRSVVRNSRFFRGHGYSDCPTTAGRFWPRSLIDCAFSDRGTRPTRRDLQILPFTREERESYPKHFTPTDGFANNSPTISGRVEFTDSFSSLHIGLQGGRNGKIVRYAALSIHPAFEGSVINRHNPAEVRRRASVLVRPFLEEAAGANIPARKANVLYDAAVNHCGTGSPDQSGYGKRESLTGKYDAAVVKWNPRPIRSKIAYDCKIFVGRKV